MARDRVRSASSSVRIANSSPPSRATRSPSRTELADPLGHRDEQRVAGGVAQRVVDDLEVVEVDEQDRVDLAAARRGRRRGPAPASCWNIRRLAAPVSESRSARSWTWRSSTALRRFSAAIAHDWPSTDVTRRSTPKTLRDRCSTTMAPDRPARRRPSARRAGCARPAGRRAGTGRAPGRAADRRAVCRRSQAVLTIASGRRWRVGTSSTPRAGEDDHPVVGRAQDDAAGEAEPLGEPVQDDAATGGPDRPTSSSRGADVDERLEVGPALAQLALVHGREDRCRQREQPERGDVEDRHASNSIAAPGDDVDRRRAAAPPGRRARRRARASPTARSSGRCGTRPAATRRPGAGR